jgi:DNA polymerase elongation subunit (family B)|tara:strand:+ start:1618 stop:4026 length:2409 start_codon:yes stop_codon:yes gene_type:complete
VKDNYGTHVSLYGDRLKKTYKWDKTLEGLHESDINPETRTLIDMYTNSDEPSVGHRIMVIDIEVEVTEGFPSPQKAENKITSIAIHDSETDQYFCYVLDEKNKLEPDDWGKNVTVETFDKEFTLLQKFYAKYLEIRPTIITGWNVDGFDIPYLYNRSQQVVGKNVADCLSPISSVYWNKYRERFMIAGVSCLDYLMLYKNFTFSSKPSYRLDEIGKSEVGTAKISYDGTLNDLYENHLNDFVKYNIHDVRIVKKLDDKLDFIDVARGICHVGHVPYEDIVYDSRFLEGAILVYLKKLGVVSPNKPPRDDVKKDGKFTGAYVQDPQKGRHDWVYDLDITSMYPSIIMSLNVSPETKIGKIEGWNPQEFIKGKNKTYSVHMNGKKKGQLTEVELKDFFDKNQVSISDNGIIYRTDKQGLIPTLLSDWFDKRKEYRKLAKKFGDAGDEDQYGYFNRRQHIQKIVLNSMYGVLGLPVFRFYDLDNAEATTKTGQALIKFTKKIGNHFYNKELGTEKDYCIYIDTDSVFYSAVPLIEHRFPNQDLSDVMKTQRINEIATEVQKYLNDSYHYFAKKFCNLDIHRFEIKQEIVAKAGLFIVKKRYGMKIISDNGVQVNKTMVKGLDTVRSNFAPLFRKLLSDVLDDILGSVPKDKIDHRITRFKKNMKYNQLDDISSPTGVKGIWKYMEKKDKENSSVFSTFKKGTPVHVKAAIAYNDLVRYFKQDNKYQFINNGDKIRWVYLKNNTLGLNAVAYKGHEDPPEIMEFINKNIDHDKIYGQSLTKKLQMFYDCLDWGKPVDEEQSIERFF